MTRGDDSIQDTILNEIEDLKAGCESLDMDRGFRVFSRSSDFEMVASDGSLCDLQAFLQGNREYFEGCREFALSTDHLDIVVLSETVAVASWVYRAEATLTSGDKDVWERAGATFVFHLEEDSWKVIRYQESALPPERIPGRG